jgi:hypothetical protein
MPYVHSTNTELVFYTINWTRHQTTLQLHINLESLNFEQYIHLQSEDLERGTYIYCCCILYMALKYPTTPHVCLLRRKRWLNSGPGAPN